MPEIDEVSWTGVTEDVTLASLTEELKPGSADATMLVLYGLIGSIGLLDNGMVTVVIFKEVAVYT